jgi:hypothetical protein
MIWDVFLFELCSRVGILCVTSLFVVSLEVGPNEGMGSIVFSYVCLTISPIVILWLTLDTPLQMLRDGVGFSFYYCNPSNSDHVQLILKRLNDFDYLMHMFQKLHSELPPFTRRFEGIQVKYADDIVFDPLTGRLRIGQETVETPTLATLEELIVQ